LKALLPAAILGLLAGCSSPPPRAPAPAEMPAAATNPLAVPMVKLHCGTKSPGMPPATGVTSFHDRDVWVRTVAAGLFAEAIPIEFCITARLALALRAVFPLPNKS